MIRLSMFFILTFLISCASDKLADKESKLSDSQENSLAEEQVKTIINFLEWYSDNINELDKIEMINNRNSVDTVNFFSVNFEGIEKYLNELKKSNYISDVYIKAWRDYFEKRNDYFKNNPQNDGIPEGFDFDFVMYSQDFEEDLANLEKVKIINKKVDTNKASITLEFISGMRLKYALTKNNGKWEIDNIQNVSGN